MEVVDLESHIVVQDDNLACVAFIRVSDVALELGEFIRRRGILPTEETLWNILEQILRDDVFESHLGHLVRAIDASELQENVPVESNSDIDFVHALTAESSVVCRV